MAIDNRVIPAVEYINDSVVPQVTKIPSVTDTLGSEASSLSVSGVGVTVDKLSTFSMFELVQMLIVYAFIAAGVLSAVFIFVGGISFILSGGQDEKIKKAINTIRYSIVGLIITILSFTFVTIIGRVFGLNFLDYITFDKITSSISKIISTSSGSQGGTESHFTLPREY